MKTASRNVALIASAGLAIALAGCSTTAATSSSTPAANLTQAQLSGKTIAFIPGTNDPFYVSMQCGIQTAAKKYGMKVNTQIPQQFSAASQTPIVNAVVATKPAAILIAPTDTNAMVSPLQQAQTAGIPVGLVDTTLADASLPFTSISTDNAAAGAKAADELAKLIGDKGKVLVIPFQAGASTSDERTSGFATEIKKYPGITELTPQINDNDPSKAASIVSAALAANPDLNGIFGTNLFAAEGAATGVTTAGLTGKVKIVGFDAEVAEVTALKRGQMQALIAQSPALIGQDAITQLVNHLTGKPVTKSIATPSVVITTSNMNQPSVKAAIYQTSCSQ